jgi:protein-tyrosine-phosphatase
MAEVLLKEYLQEEGKEDIEVKSAGVSAVDGLAPTAKTIEVMLKCGMDVSQFKSKYLTDELIKSSDLILVMAGQHRDAVIKAVPQAAQKTHLLKQYGLETDAEPCKNPDILDPIGRPVEVYEYVFDVIKEEIKRIVKLL